jgi:ribosomal protein S18 acetylase RimI-like enzyme
MAKIEIQLSVDLSDSDIGDMCDAAETAILDGGGFGWLKPPPRALLERYWRGVLLVPERNLVVGRLDGRIAGLAQLVLPPRNNEAQSRIATITSNFVAPWARGMGMARGITATCERTARQHKMQFINLDVRETQEAAIQLYESLGYERWGTNPNYAIVKGRVVAGHYYTKPLGRGARKAAAHQESSPDTKAEKKS